MAVCDENELSSEAPFRFSKFTFVNNIFRFIPFRPLNVHELVRLAPACDPETTLILTQVRESTLQIWGVVDVGGEASIRSVALDDLRIRVFGSGDMQLTLHGATLCVFKAGKIHLERGGLINEGCLYECFKKTSFELCREVKKHLGQPDWNSPVPERHVDAMMYFDALDRLIASMRRLGHGGCILMVPDSQSDFASIGVTVKYECRNNRSPAWTALKGLCVTREQTEQARDLLKQTPCDPEVLSNLDFGRHDIENGLADALETLARFTAVDGAVLMSKKLELLGFGAVVSLANDKYDVFRCIDREANITEKVSVDQYGTRHRSAFDFCHRCPSSVAFVASQDGGIKAGTRLGDAIYFWEGVSFALSNELVQWNDE